MPSRTRRPKKQDEYEEDADMSEDVGVDADSSPPTIEPYTVLGLAKDATPSQVTTAYRKAALKHHPDKVPPTERESAHAKFQEVALAYAILSDERRRKRYDITGRTDESLALDDGDDFNWIDFFRNQYRDVVTTEKIDDFANSYKGSEEERGHVLEAYTKTKGNMNKLYQLVMLSEVLDDEERFQQIIKAAIAKGEVEDYPAFSGEMEKQKKARWTSAEKKRAKEAKEASAAAGDESAEADEEEADKPKKARWTTAEKKRTKKAKEAAAGNDSEPAEEEDKPQAARDRKKNKKAASSESDLAAIIQARQQLRGQESFFDRLEAKYAPAGNKGGRKRGSDEDDGPSEEAFAANRKLGVEESAKAGAGRKRSRK